MGYKHRILSHTSTHVLYTHPGSHRNTVQPHVHKSVHTGAVVVTIRLLTILHLGKLVYSVLVSPGKISCMAKLTCIIIPLRE